MTRPRACSCRTLGSLTHGRRARPDAGDLREEPGAGKPHARIREGEAEWPSYSTTICGSRIPPALQLLTAFKSAVGRELRRTAQGGIRIRCAVALFG